MKKLFRLGFVVIIFTVTSHIQASSMVQESDYYKLLIGSDFKDIKILTKGLKKGSLLYIHDDRYSDIIPQICDYNHSIIIADGTFTCSYIGHVRRFNFRRVYDGELLTK